MPLPATISGRLASAIIFAASSIDSGSAAMRGVTRERSADGFFTSTVFAE